ncbi:MAG: hypothetical protein NW223_17500 [Hyphomicrobiaceae bacterium]|nr:hypothetical protein [Hyphomicrobiaceae bacterium]
MRLRPPLRVSVTRHDEKEQKLKDFVRKHLALAGQGRSATYGVVMVVARSVESPVVRALLGLGAEISAAGLSLRLVLAHVEGEQLPETWEKDLGALSCDVRWARRPRLIEAHEQLVVGPETCWIGDCMRRDPAKCDAFESFIEDCGEAAGCATVSFERLWGASEPLRRIGLPVVSPQAIPGLGEAHEPSIGTRH